MTLATTRPRGQDRAITALEQLRVIIELGRAAEGGDFRAPDPAAVEAVARARAWLDEHAPSRREELAALAGDEALDRSLRRFALAWLLRVEGLDARTRALHEALFPEATSAALLAAIAGRDDERALLESLYRPGRRAVVSRLVALDPEGTARWLLARDDKLGDVGDELLAEHLDRWRPLAGFEEALIDRLLASHDLRVAISIRYSLERLALADRLGDGFRRRLLERAEAGGDLAAGAVGCYLARRGDAAEPERLAALIRRGLAATVDGLPPHQWPAAGMMRTFAGSLAALGARPIGTTPASWDAAFAAAARLAEPGDIGALSAFADDERVATAALCSGRAAEVADRWPPTTGLATAVVLELAHHRRRCPSHLRRAFDRLDDGTLAAGHTAAATRIDRPASVSVAQILRSLGRPGLSALVEQDLAGRSERLWRAVVHGPCPAIHWLEPG